MYRPTGLKFLHIYSTHISVGCLFGTSDTLRVKSFKTLWDIFTPALYKLQSKLLKEGYIGDYVGILI